MTKKLGIIFSAATLCFVAMIPSAVGGLAIDYRPLHDSGTLIVKGYNPSIDINKKAQPSAGEDTQDGTRTVVFSIDVSDVGTMDYLASDYVAIIHGQEDNYSKGALCPYFNLEAREYTLSADHSHPGRKVIQVTTTTTKAERDAVRQAGCMVTNWPEYDRLQPFI